MSIKPKSNTLSFTEKHYENKFNDKRVELFKHLENNPDDLVAKQKIEFINRILEDENKDAWPAVWQNWEKQNFCLLEAEKV